MVYKARDKQLDRLVALKVPRLGVLGSDTDIQRFLREARAAGNLRHPNIVPIYDAGRIGESCFIASGFIDGRTLAACLEERERLPHREAAELIQKLAATLHYAHTKGIVHRDLKPANVMLDAEEEPMVMDFGMARRDEGEMLRTQEGAHLGTPAYMSPEQHAGQSHLADARSDQWALGVMLYEMLLGQRPFQAPSAIQLAYAVQATEPEKPRKLDKCIPKDLETICLKCLQKEPENRYASCQRLAGGSRPLAPRRTDRRPANRVDRANVAFVSAKSDSCRPGYRHLRNHAGWSGRSHESLAESGSAALARQENQEKAEKNLTEANRQTIIAQQNADEARKNADEAKKEKLAADQARADLSNNLGKLKRQTKELEDQTKQTKRALRDEEVARGLADKSSAEAKVAKAAAERSRDIAIVQAKKIEQAQHSIRLNLYAAKILLAQQAWENGDVDRVRGILDEQTPKSAADEDLRAFEWNYLAAQIGFQGCAKSSAKVDILHHRSPVYCVAASADGETAVSLGRDRTAKVWNLTTLHLKEIATPPKEATWSTSDYVQLTPVPGALPTLVSTGTFQTHVTPFALCPGCNRVADAAWTSAWIPAMFRDAPDKIHFSFRAHAAGEPQT